MDSFAISICKGLSMKKNIINKVIIIAMYFSFFHMLMPIIGYLLGNTFELLVSKIDHWIAFILLLFIGSNIIIEGVVDNTNKVNDKIDFKSMIPLCIASSIDALAVGVTFAFLKVNLFIAVISIGIITFMMSLLGVLLGNKFGNRYEKTAKILGGIILIIIGIKILLEHLNIL